MGMMGAALATGLAQGASATWVVAYFQRSSRNNKNQGSNISEAVISGCLQD